MSERSVILSVTLALVLLGAYLIIDRVRTPKVNDPVPLMTFDPAQVDRIELLDSASIVRQDVFGSSRWIVYVTTDQGEKITWPADEARMRAGLRVLTSTRITPTDLPIERSASLRISSSNGSTETVHFDRQPMAGRIVVETQTHEGRTHRGYVDASLFDAIVDTGLGAWRSPVALAAFASGPFLIELTSGTGSLILVRREARWVIAEPVAVPADSDAARALTLALAGIEILAFRDDLARTDDRTGLDTPLATIVTETDIRRGDHALLRQTVEVGGATNLGGKAVYAEITWSLIEPDGSSRNFAGPIIAELSTESLNALSTRIEPYIARRGTTFAANTIERIVISTDSRTLTLERRGLAWSTQHESLLPGDSALLTTLIETLTHTPADEVRLTDVIPSDALTVALHMGIGPPAATFALIALPEPPGILALDGQVARGYAMDADFIARLRDLVVREGREHTGNSPQPDS